MNIPVENNIVTEEVSKIEKFWRKLCRKALEKMHLVEGHTIGGKTATSQTFQEVRIAIFPLFLDLHRQMNRRL